jgi:integrase
VRWAAPEVAQTVDRRVVITPAQAAGLLAAVGGQDDRGAHLEAFFGCLYYAALRPSEAVALRDCDCVLPEHGWGRIDLAASAPRPGRAWTGDHHSRESRGLKHRPGGETRSIPIPPVLVTMLRAHLNRYGAAADGRLFRTARGGLIQDSAYTKVWQAARAAALSAAQQASPLAARPYDLRHAGVSLWLNSGVAATEVARRAGHSVAVLLTIYAHCADGQSGAANDRIAASLAAAGGQAA